MTQSLDSLEPGDVSASLSLGYCSGEPPAVLIFHDQPNMDEILDKLKETHATSAGLKAFCTWACLDTIDKCRQSCGGHGYSA
jgi:alkylation response protein AidB-like acyl-CoA dehydrogenase